MGNRMRHISSQSDGNFRFRPLFCGRSKAIKGNTIRPPPFQPIYNSETTGPIGTTETPFELGGTISSAVSKMVTSDDLGDLQRSTLRFRLLQPFYNSETTGPVETKTSPVDSAYVISSAVSKMVTSGDLGDLGAHMTVLT